MIETLYIGDKASYDPGLEEVEESTAFCDCGYSQKVIVEWNSTWKFFAIVNKEDKYCPVCGGEMRV